MPSDVNMFMIFEQRFLYLSDQEKRKIEFANQKKQYFNTIGKKQLEDMLKYHFKIEIEDLNTHDFDFLTNYYLLIKFS